MHWLTAGPVGPIGDTGRQGAYGSTGDVRLGMSVCLSVSLSVCMKLVIAWPLFFGGTTIHYLFRFISAMELGLAVILLNVFCCVKWVKFNKQSSVGATAVANGASYGKWCNTAWTEHNVTFVTFFLNLARCYVRSRDFYKKAQLTQRERATAVHVWRPTANKCKIRKNLYFSAQGNSRSLLSVSIETRVWLPISD